MESKMAELLLVRWLLKSLDRLCTIHYAVGVVCVVGMLAGLTIWDAHQSSNNHLEFEREQIRRQWAEFERQAEHQRQLELIEATKPRRDLTLPAESDEGY